MKVIKTLCMCALCIFMFFESAQTTHAEESTEYQYYFSTTRVVNGNDWQTYSAFNLPAGVKPYAYLAEGNPSGFYCFYISDTSSADIAFDGVLWKTYGSTDKDYQSTTSVYAYSISEFIEKHEYSSSWMPLGLSGAYDTLYDTNIPTFSSFDSVVAYLENGNEDGWLNKPDIDYGIEHDFASDNYRTDIPIPEVSNMDFNSFKLTNWKEEYFVDILIENRFLEVAIMNNTGNGWKKIFKPTGAKTYNWHYWNLLCHGVAYNQPDIDIPTLFGFDPQEYLIEDFKTWSEQYSDLSTIDGYDFTMIAQKDDYKERHVYDPESALTDEQQLRNSGQGMCIYWIRYSLEDGTYGQWVKYTVHDYDINAKDNDNWEDKTTVSTQIVGVNKDTGKVEYSNAITGTVSKEDGALDYTGVAGNTSDLELDSAFSYFIEMVRALMDGVGQMPEFIARMFSFFPQWFINFLCASLFAVIVLRIAGR